MLVLLDYGKVTDFLFVVSRIRFILLFKNEKMKNSTNYINQLKEIISKYNPYLILLFGSYAYGTPTVDSDIDILVVTQDNFIPQNFAEKSKIYQKISRAISSVNEEIAIDLIVHTLPMYKKFIEIDSSFAHEITTKGKIIYESNNTRMA